MIKPRVRPADHESPIADRRSPIDNRQSTIDNPNKQAPVRLAPPRRPSEGKEASFRRIPVTFVDDLLAVTTPRRVGTAHHFHRRKKRPGAQSPIRANRTRPFYYRLRFSGRPPWRTTRRPAIRCFCFRVVSLTL